MNTSNDHISYMLLVDLAAGRAELNDQMWLHLNACEQCARDVAWLERTLDLMRTDTSVDAPREVVSRAKRLFNIARPTTWSRIREHITALLTFDSASMPLAYGVRGNSSSHRQLLYNAGALDVDLRIAPKGESWNITGQLLGIEHGNTAQLRGAHGTTTAPINALGEFLLRDVAPGTYALTLELENNDIQIPAFDVG